MVNTKLGFKCLTIILASTLAKQVVKTEENELSNFFILLEFS